MAWDAGTPETLSRRVNNAFVHRLRLDFRVANLPLLYHLRANADNLQCQTKVLHVAASEDEIDYALICFLGVHLKPRMYETAMNGDARKEYASLPMHEALRGTVTHVEHRVSSGCSKLR